jgi:hypothetical protein
LPKHKPPRLERRRPTRQPKARFVLLCEGENTEPEYFLALRAALKGALIEIVPLRAAGVPKTIAEKAVELRRKQRRMRQDSFEANDEIWAVFDRDQHPHFEAAVAMCRDNNVNVARSNPCFEVWLILHEEDFHRPDDRHEAQRYYSSLRPEYDRKSRKCPDCAEIVGRVEVAESRAEKQLQSRESEGRAYGPPSTTVFLLTRMIRRAAAQALPRAQ